MPAWTDKGARMFEHARESSLDRGADPGRAEEIAGRTVNTCRPPWGETPNARTQGAGYPLEDRSVDELYSLARQLKVEGRSRMTKEQLVEALRARQ